jgi:hypothetical protein
MTPPTMAPTFEDFFPSWPLLWPSPDGVLVEPVDDGEPEPVELPDIEMVEGTGASVSGLPPAASATAGSNPFPV